MSIPPPAPHTLLPPLLACLPTAFASTRPPPALLPLLSPILRQRVQLLSDSTSSPHNSWLTKLSWDPTKAEGLFSVVESEAFELHPISNEIEFDDVQTVGYRRLDEETLQSRIDIRDLGLTVIYLWCIGDTEGGGDGWRAAEVLPLDDQRTVPAIWRTSTQEADEACRRDKPPTSTTETNTFSTAPDGIQSIPAVDEDDEDDYWAQYDAAPSSTPGPNPSPGPQQTPKVSRHGRAVSDSEYFGQYSQVQPDMDNDDPSVDRSAIGESSLNGNTIASTTNHQSQARPFSSAMFGQEDSIEAPQPSYTVVIDKERTTATSNARSATSPAVEKLEGSAMMQSQTELAVRQHMASTMKSLYRLSRSTGMEMGDFEKVIYMEVEILKLMEGLEED
ncbi:MAG: hypothetical protein Q9182_000926 [Xanthomendoza sp. 2 TL-2023]